MPQDNEAPVEVIQGDRDAAKALSSAVWILDADLDTLAAHFARHRLAYQSEAPAQGEGSVSGGLEEAARYHDVRAARWIKEAQRHRRPTGNSPCMDRDLKRAQDHRRYAEDLRFMASTRAKNAPVALPLADREAIAKTLYEHWVGEVELQGGEMASWESLRGKEAWLSRADAILALSGSLPPSPVGEGITTPAPVRGE